MISCNIAVSMQMPRERGVLSLMLVRDMQLRMWSLGVHRYSHRSQGLIRNCLDYITHLSPILFRYSIVLVF